MIHVFEKAAKAYLPDWLHSVVGFDFTLFQILILAIAIPCIWILGRLIAALIRRLYFYRYRRREGAVKEGPVPDLYFRNSIFFISSTFLFSVLLTALSFEGQAAAIMNLILRSSWILSIAWLMYRCLTYLTVQVEIRLKEDTAEPWRVRGIRTQMIMIRRVAAIVVFILTSAGFLLQFELVQKVGLSLLASAGVAGIVIGLAAQKSIASVLYGVQLALTQPVRIGDKVVVDDIFGQIEEIRLTYIVMKLWDEKRMIIPIERFLQESFENWTRKSQQLIGPVYVNVGFHTPIEELRQSFLTFLKSQPLWDGRVGRLQVTDMTETSVQLRAVVSAKDSGNVWDLRCIVREWFVTQLVQIDDGQHLPAIRLKNR